MSKFDIRPEFECRKTKNEKRKAKNEKFDIRSKFECQNKILNVKIRYRLARIRMSKKDFECQNSIFGPSSNVKIRF